MKVDLNKVNREHLKSVLADYKVQFAEAAENSVLVGKLGAHYKANPPKEEVECNVCGGNSDAELPICPYCKIGNDEEESPALAADEDVEEDEAGGEEDEDDEVSPSEAPAPPTAKVAKKEKPMTTTAMTKVNGAASKMTKGSKALDQAVTEVQQLKGEGAVSMWRLGARIKSIFEGELWMQRLDEKGKPVYKGFNAFVMQELGMTAPNAYSLMKISEAYGEADVRAFGTAKLGLLLEAPEKERAAIKGKIAKGATKREVQKAVTKAKDKHRKATGDKARSDGKGPRSPGRPKLNITIASIEGKRKIKLFANEDSDAPKRAKKISDLPWGQLSLVNEVQQFFFVKEEADGLVLVVQTKREE